MKTYIIIKTQFSAIHHWPECPLESVDFLKHPHRHIFYITVKKQVYHDDRQIEFIDFKNKINKFIYSNWEEKFLGKMSCEMIAKKLIQVFNVDFVSVFEDNENGAEVYNE